MSKIIVKGLASQKIIKQIDLEGCPQIDLLNYLRSFGIPIASSCNGDGVCKKCIFNQNKLACKTSLKDLEDPSGIINIEISYL